MYHHVCRQLTHLVDIVKILYASLQCLYLGVLDHVHTDWMYLSRSVNTAAEQDP